MAKEICNKATHCPERRHCGGARPHVRCSECGNCPIDDSADCEPVDESNAKCGHCDAGWCMSNYGCDSALPSDRGTGCERAL